MVTQFDAEPCLVAYITNTGWKRQLREGWIQLLQITGALARLSCEDESLSIGRQRGFQQIA
jgi:hypothetical protein